jgi:hypothetical protein
MLPKLLEKDGALTKGSYLMYEDRISHLLLCLFEDQKKISKKTGLGARRAISEAVLQTLATHGHGVLENGKIRAPQTADEAASVPLFKNAAAAFREVATMTKSASEQPLLKTFENFCNCEKKSGQGLDEMTRQERAEFFSTVGLDFLILLRHFQVHMKTTPRNFGKIINNKMGLSPIQFFKLTQKAGEMAAERAKA